METTVYGLSWNEDSFLGKLSLFCKSTKQECGKMRSNDRRIKADGCSALSSTCYSIVGTAFARLRLGVRGGVVFAFLHTVLWSLTWAPLGAWCFLWMLALSNRVVALVGYENMTAEECDVRQSILRRWGKYRSAELCILHAFGKNPERASIRGLLYVGLADIYKKRREWNAMGEALVEAVGCAKVAEVDDPLQASRIYRHSAGLADALKKNALGDHFRTKARQLAEKAGAKDQLLKLV